MLGGVNAMTDDLREQNEAKGRKMDSWLIKVVYSDDDKHIHIAKITIAKSAPIANVLMELMGALQGPVTAVRAAHAGGKLRLAYQGSILSFSAVVAQTLQYSADVTAVILTNECVDQHPKQREGQGALVCLSHR